MITMTMYFSGKAESKILECIKKYQISLDELIAAVMGTVYPCEYYGDPRELYDDVHELRKLMFWSEDEDDDVESGGVIGKPSSEAPQMPPFKMELGQD